MREISSADKWVGLALIVALVVLSWGAINEIRKRKEVRHKVASFEYSPEVMEMAWKLIHIDGLGNVYVLKYKGREYLAMSVGALVAVMDEEEADPDKKHEVLRRAAPALGRQALQSVFHLDQPTEVPEE